jgi:ribosomal protein S18 acetylase RimI-like enzyme
LRPVNAALTVRLAVLDDLERLLPLVQAYRIFYEQQPDVQRERSFIESHLKKKTSAMYLAEANQNTAGFAQLFKSYSTVHLSTVWILEDLFVVPKYRRYGIGAMLLEQARLHALGDGASSMFLETAYDNETAQRVYERAGWTREGRFYKYNAPLR